MLIVSLTSRETSDRRDMPDLHGLRVKTLLASGPEDFSVVGTIAVDVKGFGRCVSIVLGE